MSWPTMATISAMLSTRWQVRLKQYVLPGVLASTGATPQTSNAATAAGTLQPAFASAPASARPRILDDIPSLPSFFPARAYAPIFLRAFHPPWNKTPTPPPDHKDRIAPRQPSDCSCNSDLITSYFIKLRLLAAANSSRATARAAWVSGRNTPEAHMHHALAIRNRTEFSGCVR